jgi:hypothetical protein
VVDGDVANGGSRATAGDGSGISLFGAEQRGGWRVAFEDLAEERVVESSTKIKSAGPWRIMDASAADVGVSASGEKGQRNGFLWRERRGLAKGADIGGAFASGNCTIAAASENDCGRGCRQGFEIDGDGIRVRAGCVVAAFASELARGFEVAVQHEIEEVAGEGYGRISGSADAVANRVGESIEKSRREGALDVADRGGFAAEAEKAV